MGQIRQGNEIKETQKGCLYHQKVGKTDVGSNILKCKELTIQPLESVPSGKAKKYGLAHKNLLTLMNP